MMEAHQHADPKSKFYAQTHDILGLPHSDRVPELVRRGYDGMFFLREILYGDLFFQRNGAALEMFSIRVLDEKHRGKGLGTTMVATFLIYAYSIPEIIGVRLGAGGDSKVTRIWRKVIEGKLEHPLPFAVKEGDSVGWVRFVRRE